MIPLVVTLGAILAARADVNLIRRPATPLALRPPLQLVWILRLCRMVV